MTHQDLTGEKLANKVARGAMGETAWPTIALGLGLISAYAGTIAAYAFGAVSLWLATAILSVIVYAIYTVVHEAVHGSICGQNSRLKWLNEALGYLGGQIIGAPFTAHRKEHMAHHNSTNHHGEDPDLELVGGSLWTVAIGTFKALPLQVKYYIRKHWTHAAPRARMTLLAEGTAMLAWRLALVYALGLPAALVLLVLANLVGIFITLVLFAWIVHHPHTATGRYRDTATFVFPAGVDTLISWLWLFQNYHSVHHLFPRIPFYRYRQVFRQIEPVMTDNGAPIHRVPDRSAPAP